MQRFRSDEYKAEVTDGLDIVRFSAAYEGIHIGRNASTVETSTQPDLVIIEGDNILDLGNWFLRQDPDIDPPMGIAETFITANDAERRIAIVAIKGTHERNDNDELRDAVGNLVEGATELIEGVREERLLPRTTLDEHAESSGLELPEKFRPVLFTGHVDGKLTMFTHPWNRIPPKSAHQLGEWIIEGRRSLKKSSIWDKAK